MKNLKFPLLGLGLLFAISAVFAFNGNDKKPVSTPDVKKATPVSYHYKISSNSLTDMKNIANWEVADPDCETEGSVPCVIRYEGNISQFNTYLQTFTSAAAVTLRADERKD